MKELKFLIFVMALVLAQGAFAVTLPTTSYTPFSSSDGVYDAGLPTGVQVAPMSFTALGNSAWGDQCVESNPANLSQCQQCCTNKLISICGEDGSKCDEETLAEAEQLQSECANDCGRSLPLDTPLWVLLLVIISLSMTRNLIIRVRNSELLIK